MCAGTWRVRVSIARGPGCEPCDSNAPGPAPGCGAGGAGLAPRLSSGPPAPRLQEEPANSASLHPSASQDGAVCGLRWRGDAGGSAGKAPSKGRRRRGGLQAPLQAAPCHVADAHPRPTPAPRVPGGSTPAPPRPGRSSPPTGSSEHLGARAFGRRHRCPPGCPGRPVAGARPGDCEPPGGRSMDTELGSLGPAPTGDQAHGPFKDLLRPPASFILRLAQPGCSTRPRPRRGRACVTTQTSAPPPAPGSGRTIGCRARGP